MLAFLSSVESTHPVGGDGSMFIQGAHQSEMSKLDTTRDVGIREVTVTHVVMNYVDTSLCLLLLFLHSSANEFFVVSSSLPPVASLLVLIAQCSTWYCW